MNRGPFRPVWHKVVGGLLVLAGITVFALNDFRPEVLPGAHTELYAVLALAIAATSMWWFGWFDRPPERR